jgi:two-component system CheB/CheR fusion protein
VRAAVKKAYAVKEPASTETITAKIDGAIRSINLIVEPLPEGGAEAGLCVVAFQDLGPIIAARNANAETPSPIVQALEQELLTTKVQLSATIDELEMLNEEMRSTNEEYQSVNEELQSSNEELETAKEEMQSVNEELQTVNDEVGKKNTILGTLNSDLKNLLDSTEIATIFLDNNLRIKNFTPAMTGLFHLRDSDRGRPITEIVTRLSDTDLRRDVTNVLRTLSTVEREMQIPEGGTFIMRIRPYRTVENVIDGVVITFVDITERKQHEESKSRLAAIIESSQDAIIGHDFDGLVTSWNVGASRIFGYTADEAIGRPLSILLPDNHVDEVPRILKTLQRGERIEHFEIDRMRKDKTPIDVSLTISPVKDARGKVVAASTIAREFTERKLADNHKILLIAELNHRIKNMLMIISSLVAQTLKTTDTPLAFAEVIQGRILALSRVHDLLTANNWDQASLRDVVEGELEPYRASLDGVNIAIKGVERVILTPRVTQPLTMALHELAANAAKYGALSTTEGQVEVDWHILGTEEEPRLSIEWIETGGPPVALPTRRGFGSQLIERTVTYELQAEVNREFRPEGVRCTIEFSLTPLTGQILPSDQTTSP